MQEIVDEPLHRQAIGAGEADGVAQRVGGTAAGRGEFQFAEERRERTAQFVGGGGEELPLATGGCVEAPEHRVEDVHEAAELVVARRGGQPGLGGRDGLGGVGRAAQRPEQAPGEEERQQAAESHGADDDEEQRPATSTQRGFHGAFLDEGDGEGPAPARRAGAAAPARARAAAAAARRPARGRPP